MSLYKKREGKEHVNTHKPGNPESNFVSIKSNTSMGIPPVLSDWYPESSFGSMRSKASMGIPPVLRGGYPESSFGSERSNTSMGIPPVFSDGAMTTEVRRSRSRMSHWTNFQKLFDKNCKITAQQKRMQETTDLQKDKDHHKTSTKSKYERLFEGVSLAENQTLLNRIYTQLYIIEGESKGVNEEHEVLQMEKTARTQDNAIYCNDIFKPLNKPEHEEKYTIKSVLTKGIAGIGKTVSVQKFILDWSEGKANQDVDLMFVLPFRELNLIKDHQYSLHRLLLDFHPDLQDLDSKIFEECKVVFIFDGLDESRMTLKFSDIERVCDVNESLSVDVLMSNLIRGDLLPSALIWITSRPAAANQIPSKYISRLTEIQGFNESQKEEYFRKRISDERQASRIISHIRRSRSLHIMCHIPVFCWISATVLQNLLNQDDRAEIPQTLTEMYIHFLLTQISMRNHKYDERDQEKLLQSNRDVIVKLAELAFRQLIKGNVMFYEEDLIESGIDVTDASVYSGICTEIFKEESVIHQRKVYCFIHLSFQEFLAAFYQFCSYELDNVQFFGVDDELCSVSSDEPCSVSSDEPCSVSSDELEDSFFESFSTVKTCFLPHQDVVKTQWPKPISRASMFPYKTQRLPFLGDSWCDRLQEAVTKCLMSKNGHLDLFLRFLLGISLESNQRLLQDLLRKTVDSSNDLKNVTQYIKNEINRLENISADRCINLFLCLLEMKDLDVYREIKEYMKSTNQLYPSHCSTFAYMLQISEEVLDEFDLRKYNTSNEGRRRLIPAVVNCRKALLARCNLTDQCCKSLSSCLQSSNSLRELDLSNNDLHSGVKLLSDGLKSSQCQLNTLRFSGCNLTAECCDILSSCLQSSNTLRELDLSHNELQDSGVKLLSDGLQSLHRQLNTLRFSGCNLTGQCCESLSSCLQSSNSLMELDLSQNDLQDSGVKLLSDGLKSSHCQLNILRLSGCMVTKEGCSFLASALRLNPSHLRELDLSYNYPGQSLVKLLSDPNYRLDKLKYV